MRFKAKIVQDKLLVFAGTGAHIFGTSTALPV